MSEEPPPKCTDSTAHALALNAYKVELKAQDAMFKISIPVPIFIKR